MADIDPPYRLDPLQNIVDVKWGKLKHRFVWIITESGSNLPFPVDPVPDTPGSTCSITSSPRGDFTGLPGDSVTTKSNADNEITFISENGQTLLIFDPSTPTPPPTSIGKSYIKYTSSWWVPTGGVDPITGDANCEGNNEGVPAGAWIAGQVRWFSFEQNIP